MLMITYSSNNPQLYRFAILKVCFLKKMYAWIFHYFLPDVISKEASKLSSSPHHIYTTTILFHHNSNEFSIIKKEDFLLKCFIEKCSIFTLITNIEGSPFWIVEKSYFSMSIIIFIGGQTLFAIFLLLQNVIFLFYEIWLLSE